MFTINRIIVFIILTFLFNASVLIITPFLSALFWASILAFGTYPLMNLLTLKLKCSQSFSAAILTFIWVIVVTIPLLILALNSAKYLQDLNFFLKNFENFTLPDFPKWASELPFIGVNLNNWWVSLQSDGSDMLVTIRPYFGVLGNWILSRSAKVGNGLIEIALSLLFVFFFYRDGPKLVIFIKTILMKIAPVRSEHYLFVIQGTVKRVVNGVIGIAFLEAIAAYVSYYVANLESALFLSIASFFVSFIMFPPIIWFPVCIWLFVQEQTGLAIFIFIWGLFVLGALENILKPYLIGKGGELPLIVVILGVFGGIVVFGFIGMFLGPTLLAISYTLIKDWISQENKNI